MSFAEDTNQIKDRLQDIDGIDPDISGISSLFYKKSDNSINPDNIIVDLNVLAKPIFGRTNQLEFPINRYENNIEEEIGEISFLSHNNGINDEFRVKTSPYDIFEILKSFERKEKELYYPNHFSDFLEYHHKQKTEGRMNREVIELRDSYIDFVESNLNELDIRGAMDLPEQIPYTPEVMNEAYVGGSEDYYITEEANKLDGETGITTYDSDFLSHNIDAFPPRLFLQLSDNTSGTENYQKALDSASDNYLIADSQT